MAAVTGVLFRAFHALVITHGPSNSWAYIGGTFALGAIFLFGMATLHLGNYTLRQWIWRAPAFGAIEAAAESVASLVLILLGREPAGTGRAHLHEWPGIAAGIFLWRIVAVVAFALVLSGVVQFVRYMLLRSENRLHTAEKVHEEFVKHPEG
jgi:hypothetical protein